MKNTLQREDVYLLVKIFEYFGLRDFLEIETQLYRLVQHKRKVIKL